MDEPVEDQQARFTLALEDVATGAGPASQHRSLLSHLEADDLDRFRGVWAQLSDGQKLALLDALSRDETDSLRLDFNEVYHLGMGDSSSAVRLRAVQSTVEDESAWLLERLLTLLVSDHDADVRAAAATALEPFAQRAELGELHPTDTERIRRALLETTHRAGERLDVRAEALATLGYFSDAAVRLELEEAYQDEALRLHAIRGMGHSAEPEHLDRVLAVLEDSDDVLRRAGALAAGEIGDERAVTALVELIDDPAQPVRLAAISALGEIGGDEAREALVYALEDKRPTIREAAEEALANIDFLEDPLGA
jgi:HEAT repeat protein